MMVPLYILIALLIIGIAYRSFVNNELSFEFFLFWVFAGITLLVIVAFPDVFAFIRKLFYTGNRKGNFVFIVSIITLFMLVMRLSVGVREGNKQQEKLAQKQALLDFQLKNPERGHQRKSTLVKMAAYNEEGNIADVLRKMPEDVDVLVIDDGSTDQTAQVASASGAMVIRHPINLGQGSADITGFKFALDKGYEYVIEMDADGQHDPKDIPLFIRALEETDADVVTGSRVLGSTHPDNSALRNFFLPYYTRLLNRLTGYTLTDSMCGYKAFRMSTLRKDQGIFDEVTESQYLASELYIRYSHKGYKVTEIPVHIGNRKSGVSRKGTIRYGLRVLRIMVRVWLIEKLVMGRKNKPI